MWVLAEDETELARELAALNKQSKRFLTLARELQGLKNQAAQIKQQAKAARDQLVKLQGQPIEAGALQRLQDMIARGNTVEGQLQTPVANFMVAQSHIWLSYAKAKNVAERLSKQYDKLAASASVKAAIEAQGPARQKLGPSTVAAKNLLQVDKWPANLGMDRLASYMDGPGVVLMGIVNESVQVKFKHMNARAGYPVNLLTYSTVRDLGIEIPEDTPKRRISAAGKAMEVQPLKLDSLRLGSAVIRNVQFFALAPEDADVGNVLSPTQLQGMKPKFDANTYTTLVGDAAKGVQPADAKDKDN